MTMNDRGYFTLDKENFSELERGQEVFLDLRDPDSSRKTCIHALAVGCEGGDFVSVCISALGKAEQFRLPFSNLGVKWSARIKAGITVQTPVGRLQAVPSIDRRPGGSRGIQLFCFPDGPGHKYHRHHLADVFAVPEKGGAPAEIWLTVMPYSWGILDPVEIVYREGGQKHAHV